MPVFAVPQVAAPHCKIFTGVTVIIDRGFIIETEFQVVVCAIRECGPAVCIYISERLPHPQPIAYLAEWAMLAVIALAVGMVYSRLQRIAFANLRSHVDQVQVPIAYHPPRLGLAAVENGANHLAVENH